MEKTKNKADAKTQHASLAGEIWGTAFIGAGLLVLISIVSHFINADNNILGPIVGHALANGMVKIFGRISSFLIPAGIIMSGFRVFKGRTLSVRGVAFWSLLAIELCVLLGIYNLPLIRTMKTWSPNIIGNASTYLLSYVFGPHRFGPYFICIFAMAITLVIGLHINIRTLVVNIWQAAVKACGWLFGLVRGLAANLSPAKQAAAEKENVAPINEKRAKKVKAATADPGPASAPASVKKKEKDERSAAEEPSTEDVEEEAKKLFDEELAAFRAKRHEPLKITTMETAAEEDEEYEEPEDEDDIDPAVIENEIEDYYKVPGEEILKKPKKRQTKPYVIPSPDIIPDPPPISTQIDRNVIEENSRTLEKTLLNFGVEGKVINVNPGPVVTLYEIELAPGIKISKIVSLHDDLSMAVGGKKIRIEAPIPGKAAVGIEIPNEDMQMVYFKHILLSDLFRKTKYKLPIIIGRDIYGAPHITDIRKMPHLLIAGQTGSGKSVCINTLICSLLMTKKPDELRFIMVDPKKVELSYYEGIPHLLSPVVTESKEAVRALQWGVIEMSRRYRLLAKAHARNIDSFNTKIEEKSIKEGVLSDDDNKPLPFIVIIVDELADLMLTASRDVEGLIQRIAQLARAVGIHLIVATQRPSVDIITGPIKANLSARIAFRTIQAVDSRTILGHMGSEKLLGRGDMLFLRSGAPDIDRFHGAFISEEDVELVVDAVKSQDIEIERIESFKDVAGGSSDDSDGSALDGDSGARDERFEEAARLIVSIGQGSTSLLQRRLKLGYARAGRLMDELHNAGIVGPQEGSKMREVLVRPEELEAILKELQNK